MARRSNTHLTKHGNGHRYFRSVPRNLRSVVGQTAWSKYIGIEHSWSDALKETQTLDALSEQTINHLRGLTDADRAQITAAGGLVRLTAQQREDLQLVAALDDMAAWVFDGPAFEGGPIDEPVPEALEDQIELTRIRMKKTARVIEGDTKKRARLLVANGLSDHRGLGSMIALQAKAKPQAEKSLARARLYVGRFVKHLGSDRAPQQITQQDAVGWRDALNKDGLSGVNQAQHLAKLSALYATAVSEGVVSANPFAGVKPRYTQDERRSSRKKRAFTHDELAKFKAAARTHGGSFNTILTCLRLTGARSSEICGLRVRDVKKINGVLCFDINDEVRPLKNSASARNVPVPSILKPMIAKLTKRRDGAAPLFEGLPMRKGGPAHKVQITASKLIRAHVSKDGRCTLHSLRHTWRQKAAALKIDADVSRAVLGHSRGRDVHDAIYGERPRVEVLSQAVEKVARALG